MTDRLRGVVIYGRMRDLAHDGGEFQTSAALCSEWADAFGFQVYDEVTAWQQDAECAKPQALMQALDTCLEARAGLLVADIGVLGGDPAWIVRHLDPLPVLTANQGRVVLAQSHGVTFAPVSPSAAAWEGNDR